MKTNILRAATAPKKPIFGGGASRPQPDGPVYRLDMTLPGAPERPGSRAYKEPKTKSRGRKIAARSLLTLVLLVMFTSGGLFAKGYIKLHKAFKGGAETVAALQAPAFSVNPNALKGEGSGRINILLLGKGGAGHNGPDLTDTMLLASIDPVDKTTALLSIPRDLWVTIPGYAPMKINAAYALAKYKAQRANPKDPAAAQQAGISNVEAIVSQVIGVPINYYAMLDFTAFKSAIDTVGGVTVNVPDELYDPTMAWENNGSPVLASKGVQQMSGSQALSYVRSRETSSDFARSERQRAVITALQQKVLSVGTLSNPLKLSSLLSSFGDHFTTDLSIANAERLGNIIKGIDFNNVVSIGLADPPNTFVRTDRVGSQSVVRPVAGFNNYTAIQAFVRGKLKDGYITKENAKVFILNSSSQPLAGQAESDLLKSYGYNVVGAANSGSVVATTKLLDTAGSAQKYTRHYLEERFHVTAEASPPNQPTNTDNAEFVIIIGNDNAATSNQTN